MHNVVSFSGGKDSTAMLLLMLENQMPIDEVVFCDTDMEFPQMYDHISLVEKKTGIQVTRLKQEKSFEYWATEHLKKNGNVGYWWPNMMNRWCTSYFKSNAFKKYTKQKYGKDVVKYVGIALDEPKRIKNDGSKYPLYEYGITEAAALKMCYERGYHWNGLYETFQRVSCYCCPLQRIGEARSLYRNYPDLYQRILDIEKKTMALAGDKGRWKLTVSAKDLATRFEKELLEADK